MDIPLIQYICDGCGKLSEVIDVDDEMPKGWMIAGLHTHFCDVCAKKHKDPYNLEE